jgi:hypothetical protein
VGQSVSPDFFQVLSPAREKQQGKGGEGGAAPTWRAKPLFRTRRSSSRPSPSDPTENQTICEISGLSRNDEALALLQEAARHLESAAIFASLAPLQFERGEYAEAPVSWRRWRDLSPLVEKAGQAFFAARLADCHYQLGDLAEAFLKRYEPFGLRGMLLLPSEQAESLVGLSLPEKELFDLHHRLALFAERELACYDGDRHRQFAASEALVAQWPDCRNFRWAKLCGLGDMTHASEWAQPPSSMATRLSGRPLRSSRLTASSRKSWSSSAVCSCHVGGPF